jgi:hypothetical protein
LVSGISVRALLLTDGCIDTDDFSEQLKQGLQGIVMGLFTRVMGWTPTEVELFLVDLRKELNDKSYHLLDHASVHPFLCHGSNPKECLFLI